MAFDAYFFGAPPAEFLTALKEHISKKSYEKYVTPFAGRFAVAVAIAQAGVKPEKIYTSDISLFSSLLGYYLAGKDLSELNIEIKDSSVKFVEEYRNGKAEEVAALLLAMRICQLDRENDQYYGKTLLFIRKELLRNFDKYFEHTLEEVREHKKLLGGINYEIADARAKTAEFLEDEKALIFYDPPVQSNYYAKFFDLTGKIEWAAPRIPDMTPDELPNILKELLNAKATIFLSKQSRLEKIEADGWHQVVAKRNTSGSIDFLLSNKPLKEKKVFRPSNSFIVGTYPIFGVDDTITRKSKLTMVKLSKNEAYYYKTLIMHRPSPALGESPYALLIDGKVFAVMGFSTSHLLQHQKGMLFETYGGVVSDKRYKKLAKLYMRAMLCGDAKKVFEANEYLGIHDLEGIETAVFSPIPKDRAGSGVMKTISKEKMPNGMWKIRTVGYFNNKTFKQTLLEWMDEENKYRRLKGMKEIDWRTGYERE